MTGIFMFKIHPSTNTEIDGMQPIFLKEIDRCQTIEVHPSTNIEIAGVQPIFSQSLYTWILVIFNM